MSDEEITGMYELLAALEEVIQVADPNKREALAETMQAYHDDFPEEFHWAIGAQSPSLLYHLMNTIGAACQPDETDERPGRGIIRLVHRKPEGNA
jgi:hypothetical protein